MSLGRRSSATASPLASNVWYGEHWYFFGVLGLLSAVGVHKSVSGQMLGSSSIAGRGSSAVTDVVFTGRVTGGGLSASGTAGSLLPHWVHINVAAPVITSAIRRLLKIHLIIGIVAPGS